MDKIILNNMSFYGYHGLYPEENKLGQRFYVSLEIEVDLKKAGNSDKMEDSIHYGEVYELTKEIVEGEAKNLVEAVAEDIAQTLLKTFSNIHAVKVKILKPNAPIPGIFDHVAVEIYRENEK